MVATYMPRSPTSSIQIAIDGWRFAIRAMIAMPRLFGSGFGAIIAFELIFTVSSGWQPPEARLSLAKFVWNTGEQIVFSIIQASILIAVHRFVILGEVSDRLISQLPAAYRRFLGWLLLFDLIWLPNDLYSLLGSPRQQLVFEIIAVPYYIFTVVVSLRLISLFPAIALESANAEWRRAWRDSRGHAWKFLFVSVLPLLPAIVPSLALFFVVGLPSPDGHGRMGWAVFVSVSSLLGSSVSAAVASRLFQIYGHGLDRPDQSGAFAAPPG